MKMVPLSELVYEFTEKLGSVAEPTVLTLTEKNGFISQAKRFNKRLAVGDTSSYKVIRKGDIAFNPYLLWAGAVAHNSRWEIGIISPLYPTFRAHETFDSHYLEHLLLTPAMIKRYDGIAFGSVPRKRRSTVKDFLALQVPEPPMLEEQQRIAAILDKAEELRAKRRKTLTHLDTLAQSIFHEMFGKRAKHRDGIVADYGQVQGGLQVTSKRAGYPLQVPYLRVANVYRGSLDMSEIKTIRVTEAELQRVRLQRNDILIVEGHGNPKEIGRCARWDGTIENIAHQNHLIRLRLDSSRMNPVFVEHYLNSPDGRRHLLSAGKTTTGLNTISTANVKQSPMIAPALLDQEEFAARIAAVERLKEHHRTQLAHLDTLFASLQHRAFKGEL